MSDKFNGNIGTPQGGVTGPLTYILFINNIKTHLNTGKILRKYADDIFISVNDLYINNLKSKIDKVRF